MMKRILSLTVFILTIGLLSSSVLYAENIKPSDYLKEIELLKQEEVAYHVKNFEKLDSDDKKRVYSQCLGFETTDQSSFVEEIEKAMENAYIYYVAEDGSVYDKTGKVAFVDLNTKSDSDFSNTSSAASIYGSQYGAFIRQTSYQGYMGISSNIFLPSKNNSSNDKVYLINPDTGNDGDTLYLYNFLRLNDNSFAMEGGFQYSYTYDNYSPYIRINGGALIFKDINGNAIPRFISNESIIHNLRYENDNKKVKYYANGESSEGMQYIVMGYDKQFTSNQLSSLRAGRVTNIAKHDNDYNGSQLLGYVKVNYSNTKLLKTNGDILDLESSLLDVWQVDSKIYGTVDWYTTSVTKTPSTGNIKTQYQYLNCN